jgi:hypothetical protein
VSEVDFFLSDAEGELSKVDSEQWEEFVIALLVAMIRGAPPLC